jgi:hypothetical protein
VTASIKNYVHEKKKLNVSVAYWHELCWLLVHSLSYKCRLKLLNFILFSATVVLINIIDYFIACANTIGLFARFDRGTDGTGGKANS